MNRGEFANRVVKGLGATVTLHTRRAMQAQLQTEGGDAKYNPFNTTQKMPNSTRYNSAGVQNYATPQEGIQATVKTLHYKEHGYEKIINYLKANKSAVDICKAIAESDWGTGEAIGANDRPLILDVLDDIKHDRKPNTLKELEAKKIAG